MKEERFFFVPDAQDNNELPQDEAVHAVRVLRLKEDDDIFLMDGKGCFYHAVVTFANAKHCSYDITETMPQQREWKNRIHIAIAPTKMMERMEWMAEKATEMGIDELSFLDCQYSERKKIRIDRIEKIVVAAMKQSRKAWKPITNEMLSFKEFITTQRPGRKFICHCHNEFDREELLNLLTSAVKDNATNADDEDITILIGPEGDFSMDEVQLALDNGYTSVSLGKSRLRTETAGLAAVMTSHICSQLCMLAFFVMMLFTSCTKQEYTNSIPYNTTALISANAADITGDSSPFASILEPFVDKETKQLKAINHTEDIYLFSSADGNLGICAPVGDDSSLADFASTMESHGILKNHTEKDGKQFYTFKDQWVMGYNDGCMLIMGPVTGADAQARLIRHIARLMEKDEDESVKATDLWQHLEQQKGKIRMVAQASALPEQLSLIVMLGTPKGTDPSDVLLEASLDYNDGVLTMNGKTSSYNTNVEQAMKQSQTVYRPITIDWKQYMTDSIVAAIFMNVKGKDIMPYIQQIKTLNTMLMGSDAYDKIRNNDGNLVITMTPKKNGKGDDAYNALVTSPEQTLQNNDERMVAAINVKGLTEPIAQSVAPFLGNIKMIVYNLKGE